MSVYYYENGDSQTAINSIFESCKDVDYLRKELKTALVENECLTKSLQSVRQKEAIAEAVQPIIDKPLSERMELSKYHREIKPGVWVDVYDILGACTGHYDSHIKPIVDHLVKKLLAGGVRGHKDLRQDMVDVRDSAQRAIDTIDEWA